MPMYFIFVTLNIEDVDEHLDILKNRVLLAGQEVLHELVLTIVLKNLFRVPSAIPEVQGQAAHEFNFGLSNVDSKTDVHGLLGFDLKLELTKLPG
jgi:hypothetical protein